MVPRKTADYLRQLFDRTGMAILVADNDGRYVDANAAAERLLGSARNAIVGRSVRDFIPEELVPDVETQWQAFLRDGMQSGVFELRRPDGTRRRVSFYAEANFAEGLHCSFLLPFDATAPVDGRLLMMCSWTKRVKQGERWIPVEDYIAQVQGVRVSHGMSPDAYQHYLSEVNDGRASGDSA